MRSGGSQTTEPPNIKDWSPSISFMPETQLSYKYFDRGSKGTIILLHGLGADKETYNTAEEYMESQNILIIDHVGHGKSPNPDTGYTMEKMAEKVYHLLDELISDGKVRLVLHSMGGAIGIFLAEMLGDRLEKIVFAEGNIDFDDCFFSNWIITKHTQEEWKQKGFQRMAKRFNEDPDNQVYAKSFEEAGAETTYLASVDLVEVSKQDILLDRLVRLGVPVLAVFGEKNKGRYPSEDRLREHFPVVYISGAGHNMMLDNPVEFYSVVLEYLV